MRDGYTFHAANQGGDVRTPRASTGDDERAGYAHRDGGAATAAAGSGHYGDGPNALEEARPLALIPRGTTEVARSVAFQEFMQAERPRPTGAVGHFAERLRPQVAVWVDMLQLDNREFRDSLERIGVECSDGTTRPVVDALQFATNVLEAYLEAHSIGNTERAGLVTCNQHDTTDKIITGAKTLLGTIKALQDQDPAIRAAARRSWARSIKAVFGKEAWRGIWGNIKQSMRDNPDLWRGNVNMSGIDERKFLVVTFIQERAQLCSQDRRQ